MELRRDGLSCREAPCAPVGKSSLGLTGRFVYAQAGLIGRLTILSVVVLGDVTNHHVMLRRSSHYPTCS